MTLTWAATMRQPSGKRTQVCICRPVLPGAVVAPEQRRRDRAVSAVGHDSRALQPALEARRRARRAKRLDRLVAVEVFSRAIADCVFALQKELIERLDVIVDERALVVGESGFDFGFRFRIVDRHGVRFRFSSDWRSALRNGMSAN